MAAIANHASIVLFRQRISELTSAWQYACTHAKAGMPLQDSVFSAVLPKINRFFLAAFFLAAFFFAAHPFFPAPNRDPLTLSEFSKDTKLLQTSCYPDHKVCCNYIVL